MKATEVMAELKAAASEQTRKIYLRHDAGEEALGVSMAHIGTLHKRIHRNHELACELWETGIMEARYLAALIADPDAVTASDLDRWLSSTSSRTVLESFLRHLVAKSLHGQSRATKWIDAREPFIAQAGWTLLAVLVKEGPEFQDAQLNSYLERIEANIHASPNRTRYAMNSALISIGSYNERLRETAISTAKRIGKVEVDHGDTSCKTPDAVSYILKAAAQQSSKKHRSRGA